MNLVGAGGNRRQRVSDGQAAVAVTVPIHSDLFSRRSDNLLQGEPHEVVGAYRRGVTDGVAKDDGARPTVDGGGVECLDRRRVGAGGVFGDVHHRQALREGKANSVFRGALQVVDSPVFYQPPDGARTQKRRRFDGDSCALRHFGDGANVVLMGARGTVGADLHLGPGDFAGQGFRISQRTRPSAGQADIHRVDSQRLHQVQNFNLFPDRGVVNGGVLETIPEGFVVEHDSATAERVKTAGVVPIVDQFVQTHFVLSFVGSVQRPTLGLQLTPSTKYRNV